MSRRHLSRRTSLTIFTVLQLPFTRHFHPSVSLQANQLLDLRLPLSGSADIEQNTLVAFLDRFAYRNPKKTIAARGASIMQPAAVARSGAVSVIKGKGSRVAQADGYVNDEKFWNKKVEDVPADQVSCNETSTIRRPCSWLSDYKALLPQVLLD